MQSSLLCDLFSIFGACPRARRPVDAAAVGLQGQWGERLAKALEEAQETPAPADVELTENSRSTLGNYGKLSAMPNTMIT